MRKQVERVFEAPFLAHAPMEPMNCTAHVQADRCDVWVPTQSQTATQQAAMAASGLPESQGIRSHHLCRRRVRPAGGRRLRHRRRGDVEGGERADQGRSGPGRTTRSTTSTGRSPTCACGAPSTRRAIRLLWKQRIVQQSLLKKLNPNALAGSKGVDAISVEGAANLPYAIPEPARRIHRDGSRHPVRLLAIGRQLGQRVRHRSVHRRTGDRRR